jgi:hypothetical protein
MQGIVLAAVVDAQDLVGPFEVVQNGKHRREKGLHCNSFIVHRYDNGYLNHVQFLASKFLYHKPT